MPEILQVWRDGRAHEETLAGGDPGVEQTVRYMARFAREDSRKGDLRQFFWRYIVRGKRYSEELCVRRLFDFAQHEIVWTPDPVRVERVRDAWSTLCGVETAPAYSPEGDCGIKSTFLATGLGCFGLRPYYTAITTAPGQSTFKHLFISLPWRGRLWTLDPTPPDRPAGWEAPHIRVRHFQIFD